jgi:hypothetical protein
MENQTYGVPYQRDEKDVDEGRDYQHDGLRDDVLDEDDADRVGGTEGEREADFEAERESEGVRDADVLDSGVPDVLDSDEDDQDDEDEIRDAEVREDERLDEAQVAGVFASAEAPTAVEGDEYGDAPVATPVDTSVNGEFDDPAVEPVPAVAGSPADAFESQEVIAAVPEPAYSAVEATPGLPGTPDFSQRWHEIKASFVDDPRQAVEEADALVEEAVNALTSLRKTLSDRWQSAGDSDTEQLRLTLREYRALFDRLNSGK